MRDWNRGDRYRVRLDLWRLGENCSYTYRLPNVRSLDGRLDTIRIVARNIGRAPFLLRMVTF